MLKRILVALDPDNDTSVALRYATEIARRHDAEVAGAALVHTGYLESGGGIGSMYYAEKLRDSATEESRTRARQLVEAFETQMRREGVRFTDFIHEGVPNERLIEDMMYYDLLIIGRDPHFVYSRPTKETNTIEHVVYETVSPTFVVREEYRPVERVLIAFDGSRPSARTLHSFAQLKPFGTEIELDLVFVYGEDHDRSEALLEAAGSYLVAHGYAPRPVGLSGSEPHRQIVEHAKNMNADLVISGAHSVSKLRRLAFGSTTANLLQESPSLLFLDS